MEQGFIYRNFENGELFEKLQQLREGADISTAGELLAECVAMVLEDADENGYYGNLVHVYLTNLLVNEENSYSLACEKRGAAEGSINAFALHDMEVFRKLYDMDFEKLAKELCVPEAALIVNYKPFGSGCKTYSRRIRDSICELAAQLGRAEGPEQMKGLLADFYREYGVGTIGLHKAFRIEHNEAGEAAEQTKVVPIRNILHVNMEDLVGYELAKKKLIENTEAFVAGRPANNCLLYGEAGTGKSSSIKALANEYYDRGLRIIEVSRYQFRDLNHVISRIKNRNYRFVLYMDDLSFEENETEYKYLKAVIEGGLEKKPSNVLIYATSNRRHLIRESFHDRDGVDIADKHGGDTVQEKLSLASRFGVSIYYGAPTFDEYHEIVSELAERNGIQMDAEALRKEATRWEMNHGGLSGRTAQQFIDHLLGSMQ